MSKLLHCQMTGELTRVDTETSTDYLLDGQSILDELDKMVGKRVSLDVLAVEESPQQPQPGPYPVPDSDFINRLMGDDGRAQS